MNPPWLEHAIPTVDQAVLQQAKARQTQLTKPPGSLGRLEDIAVRFAAMQGTLQPCLDKVHIVVFAGDHGVAEEGVSAFPQVVTTEMVRNFSRGGAAINVLAKNLHGNLEVVNVGTINHPGDLPNVVDQRIAPGTANMVQQPAMGIQQLIEALNAGRDAILRGGRAGMQLFIGGDMGIGNTTSASALACALLKRPAEDLTGPGTGLDSQGVIGKAHVVRKALEKHHTAINTPLEALCCLGGFEIAALVGAYMSCAQQGVPILVDGFITSVAALIAVRVKPQLKDWLLFAHCSAEPGHGFVLDALQAEPLLNLNMRLGEGSGAAVAVPLLRLAIATHNEMATFSEAEISEN